MSSGIKKPLLFDAAASKLFYNGARHREFSSCCLNFSTFPLDKKTPKWLLYQPEAPGFFQVPHPCHAILTYLHSSRSKQMMFAPIVNLPDKLSPFLWKLCLCAWDFVTFLCLFPSCWFLVGDRRRIVNHAPCYMVKAYMIFWSCDTSTPRCSCGLKFFSILGGLSCRRSTSRCSKILSLKTSQERSGRKVTDQLKS